MEKYLKLTNQDKIDYILEDRKAGEMRNLITHFSQNEIFELKTISLTNMSNLNLNDQAKAARLRDFLIKKVKDFNYFSALDMDAAQICEILAPEIEIINNIKKSGTQEDEANIQNKCIIDDALVQPVVNKTRRIQADFAKYSKEQVEFALNEIRKVLVRSYSLFSKVFEDILKSPQTLFEEIAARHKTQKGMVSQINRATQKLLGNLLDNTNYKVSENMRFISRNGLVVLAEGKNAPTRDSCFNFNDFPQDRIDNATLKIKKLFKGQALKTFEKVSSEYYKTPAQISAELEVSRQHVYYVIKAADGLYKKLLNDSNFTIIPGGVLKRTESTAKEIKFKHWSGVDIENYSPEEIKTAEQLTLCVLKTPGKSSNLSVKIADEIINNPCSTKREIASKLKIDPTYVYAANNFVGKVFGEVLKDNNFKLPENYGIRSSRIFNNNCKKQ